MPSDSPFSPVFRRPWNRRTSQQTPTRFVMNPSAPAPTSNAGIVVERSKTLNAVVVTIRITPPPTTA